MNDLFLEYEIESLKANHAYESAFDNFVISLEDLINKKKNGLIAESTNMDFVLIQEAEKFAEAIASFFQNIIENAKNLAHDVQTRMSTIVQKQEVNKKLDNLKKTLASEKSIANEKMDVMDTKKYYKAYTDYINFVVSEVKKLYSKQYENIDDYYAAFDKFYDGMENKIKDLKLDNNDAFIIADNVSAAIKYTESEILSRNSVSSMVQQKWVDAINEFHAMAKKEADSARINGLKRTASAVSAQCSTVYRNITTHSGNILSKLLSLCKNPSESPDSE